MPEVGDGFAEIIAEVADGLGTPLLDAERWDDFVVRLGQVVGDLPPRRRQALLMLMFALLQGRLELMDARKWLQANDTDSDEGLEAMVLWLRRFRPDGSDMTGER